MWVLSILWIKLLADAEIRSSQVETPVVANQSHVTIIYVCGFTPMSGSGDMLIGAIGITGPIVMKTSPWEGKVSQKCDFSSEHNPGGSFVEISSVTDADRIFKASTKSEALHDPA